MDAQRLLRRMCERHRLPFERAETLLPLIERALISPGCRCAIAFWALVDTNLSKQKDGDSPGSTLAAVERDLDEEVLVSVAKRHAQLEQARANRRTSAT